MKNIGFIGVGYMGYGIAKNILKAEHNLFVVANKNRKPIDKIVSEGAMELKSFDNFKDKLFYDFSEISGRMNNSCILFFFYYFINLNSK